MRTGRPACRSLVSGSSHVSIRARCGHRDAAAYRPVPRVGFNPRPGADTGATRGALTGLDFRCFNPRPAHRGDLYATLKATVFKTFQSAPRCGHGRRAQSYARARVTDHPFIRAPVRTPGRRVQSADACNAGMFQSAPRCGHRGDHPGCSVCPGRQHVSIRAPVRTPGRHFVRWAKSLIVRFQSAPRCGHRGDAARVLSFLGSNWFQSAPGADTGATPFFALGCRLQEQFQSAPRCGHRGD